MALADPLVICREILLSDAAVLAITDQVYGTPMLPPDHTYPMVRLTHIGTNDHARVGFRHSALASVQVDCWAYSQTECAELAEAVLDSLQGVPAPGLGAVYIAVTYEASELDESAQPPLYRRRADVSVRITQHQEVANV